MKPIGKAPQKKEPSLVVIFLPRLSSPLLRRLRPHERLLQSHGWPSAYREPRHRTPWSGSTAFVGFRRFWSVLISFAAFFSKFGAFVLLAFCFGLFRFFALFDFLQGFGSVIVFLSFDRLLTVIPSLLSLFEGVAFWGQMANAYLHVFPFWQIGVRYVVLWVYHLFGWQRKPLQPSLGAVQSHRELCINGLLFHGSLWPFAGRDLHKGIWQVKFSKQRVKQLPSRNRSWGIYVPKAISIDTGGLMSKVHSTQV